MSLFFLIDLVLVDLLLVDLLFIALLFVALLLIDLVFVDLVVVCLIACLWVISRFAYQDSSPMYASVKSTSAPIIRRLMFLSCGLTT